ncbi:MAG: hypothetical protein HY731_11300 [Candidatus Tectomicrobia bacterium]|nr:hypothetical protein [Candidatus Tectomicrobia bacterium]
MDQHAWEESWRLFDLDIDSVTLFPIELQTVKLLGEKGLRGISDLVSLLPLESAQEKEPLFFVKPDWLPLRKRRMKNQKIAVFTPSRPGELLKSYEEWNKDRMIALAPHHLVQNLPDPISLLLESSPTDGSFWALPSFLHKGRGFPNLALYPISFPKEKLTWEIYETVKGIKRKVCQKGYERLRTLLQGSNEEFRRNLPAIVEAMPVEMRNMDGLPQKPGHWGYDPVEHTAEVLKELSKSTFFEEHCGLSLDDMGRCRELIRCATVFHDLGKKVNPFDDRHPILSAYMVSFHLEAMDYSEGEIAIITKLVATHDILGRIKQWEIRPEQGYRMLTSGITDFLPPCLIVMMHYEIARADIASIGVLFGVTIDREYDLLQTYAKADN